MTNAVAVREEKDPLRGEITRMSPDFQNALPSHIDAKKFTRVAMTAINTNPDLRNADKKSLFGALMKLAQDGLLPDNREAALVIFNQKNRSGGWDKKVQAMPMIAGVLKKVRQSGEVASVDCHVVYSNDKFTYRPGIDTAPVFEPDWFGDRGTPIGAYAIATLKSGEVVPPEIMNVDQINKVRGISRSKDKGPWVDWWDEMARKTVMRRFAKRLPSSTDLEDEIFSRDETLATDMRPVAVEAAANESPKVSRLEALEGAIEEAEVEAEPTMERRADENHGDQFHPVEPIAADDGFADDMEGL